VLRRLLKRIPLWSACCRGIGRQDASPPHNGAKDRSGAHRKRVSSTSPRRHISPHGTQDSEQKVIVPRRAAARPFRRSLWVALLCLSLSGVAEARELVILVQPSTATRELREAFNRLRGELLLHGFSIEVVTVDETISSEE